MYDDTCKVVSSLVLAKAAKGGESNVLDTGLKASLMQSFVLATCTIKTGDKGGN